MLHKVEINEHGVCLDGRRLEGVRSYKLIHDEGEDMAVLLLKMDVTIHQYMKSNREEKGERSRCMK